MSDIPSTLEELKELILALIPGADFSVDENTEEIIIYTNLIEDINGDLEELDEDYDPEDVEFLDAEPLEEENEDD